MLIMPNQLGMNVNMCREDNVIRHQHQHHRHCHHIPEYADYVALIEKGYQQAQGRRWCCCSLLRCYSGFAGNAAENMLVKFVMMMVVVQIKTAMLLVVITAMTMMMMKMIRSLTRVVFITPLQKPNFATKRA